MKVHEHHRRSLRLQGYDYSQPGAYFLTLVTHDRACLFGEVVDGEVRLSEAGQIAERCWLDIPNHFPHATLDAFFVMPNHVHGIIALSDAGKTERCSPTGDRPVNTPADLWTAEQVGADDHSPLPSFQSPSGAIGSIVRGFKIGVTRWFRQHTDSSRVWQRNYYEHIVRDEQSLARIRRYIADNPLRWADDPENPTVADKAWQRTPDEPWRV
ncbi:hypothetical protein HRbin26_02291 [bacterium HR26]|nr:hypothetical protein HRbin26_02291 [bacterium HR26]